jgi:hypothetical protein
MWWSPDADTGRRLSQIRHAKILEPRLTEVHSSLEYERYVNDERQTP